MQDRSGQQIDTYYLLQLLGQGTYGEVYLAKERLSGNLVAIKILFPSLDIEQLRDAFNEARIGRLSHPNIMRIKDFGVEDGLFFLVMDYMANGTLRQLHPRGKRVTIDVIMHYVEQVSGALQQIHAFGKVHRDIKPENMLIGPNNEILLSDFGIATTSYTIKPTQQQVPAGTLAYIAPEQIQMQAVRASDQYSLAIIVYEWLTGTPPFVGTKDEIIFHHLKTSPLPLRQRVSTISPEIEAVIMKALEKDPNQRYVSVKEFAIALKKASVLSPKIAPSIFRGHTDGVRTLAWSSDSRYVVSGGSDEYIHIWEAKMGELFSTYRRHRGEVWGVAWTPRQEYVASAGQDGSVQVWEVATGISVFTYETHIGEVRTVAWSPDSKYIASGGNDMTIQQWDMTGCLAVYSGHDGAVETLSWSPDGAFMVSGDVNGVIYVWKVSTKTSICTYDDHNDRVTTVSWSPDSKYIASGSWDKTVQVWEAMTGRSFMVYDGHRDSIESLSWSPDGKYIASGSWDKTVHVWEVASGKCFFTYTGHESWVNVVAWSPDGKYIASGSWDKTVHVWQLPSIPYISETS